MVTRRNFLFSGIGALAGCSPVGFVPSIPGAEIVTDIIVDTYVDDVSLPSRGNSRYAVKLYEYSDNSLGDAENLLFEADGRWARFVCSMESPLEIVVGFEKEFEQVWLKTYQNKGIRVEGAITSPIVLAKSRSSRFAMDFSRGERGYSGPVSRDAFGGETQIDVGPGPGRIFKFRAFPEVGEVEVGINYITIR